MPRSSRLSIHPLVGKGHARDSALPPMPTGGTAANQSSAAIPALWRRWLACAERTSRGPRRSTRPPACGVRHPASRWEESSVRLPIAAGRFAGGCPRDERSHAALRRNFQSAEGIHGCATLPWERHSHEWRFGGRQSGDCRSRAAARLRAVEEEVALAGVAGEGGGALEFGAGLVEAAELFPEVAAHAGQEVVSPKRGLRHERVDELEACGWTEGHCDCNRAIQLHDGGWRELGKRLVERDDARPVRFFGGERSCVTGGNRSLECVRTPAAAKLLGPLQRGEATTDEELIPEGPVLLEEEDGLSGRTNSGV